MLSKVGTRWEIDGVVAPNDTMLQQSTRRFGHAVGFEDPFIFVGAPEDDAQGQNAVRTAQRTCSVAACYTSSCFESASSMPRHETNCNFPRTPFRRRAPCTCSPASNREECPLGRPTSKSARLAALSPC